MVSMRRGLYAEKKASTIFIDDHNIIIAICGANCWGRGGCPRAPEANQTVLGSGL
jgi:hypothetical protein